MLAGRIAVWGIVPAVLVAVACGGCAPGASGGGGSVSPPDEGTAYYVAPDGSDSNPGTQEQPWRTIQKAADTLVAGETVYIREGTYAERVVPANSGTADGYIVYAAYPDETVTIDGTEVELPEWAALFDILDRAYIRVSGLRVMNAGPNPHNPGIQSDGSSHVIIENNYVFHTNDSGIGIWNSNDVIVHDNEVVEACQADWNECITVGATDGFEVSDNLVYDSPKEGICTKDGSSNGRVFGNEVHDTESPGFYVDAQGEHTYNIEVFDNVAHDIVEDGFAVASEVGGLLENVDVYNNVAYNNGWVGIHVTACCIDTHPISGVQIINNTCFNNGRGDWGGGIAMDNTQAEGVVIRNNVCSQNLSFQIAVATDVPVGTYTVDHNLIDGYRGGAEGEMYGDNPVEGDPLFADPAGADFHLQAGSPAIDAGSDADAPDEDYDGDPRPDGEGYDIGADEYVSP